MQRSAANGLQVPGIEEIILGKECSLCFVVQQHSLLECTLYLFPSLLIIVSERFLS
uniref:Uncharacterized protein n=1 Tax=Triticum urartu TaxID=4572 RepID=A0A8R7PDP7_TRIUA